MSEAEAFLAGEYEPSRDEVQRTVAAKLGSRRAGVDLDAAYNEAWHALYLRLQDGGSVDNHLGFLVTVAYRRALSEHRARRREQATDAPALDEVGVDPDLDARLDAEIQLRHFVQGLRAELGERELRAATLCYLHGLSRPEAAKLLGVAPRRMEKLMDRATRRIGAVIGAVRPGGLCQEFDSLIRAFAVGLLDESGERYRLARDHLADCPACRRKVLVLRGLGAITPPDPQLLAALSAAAGAGAGGIASQGAGAASGARRLAGKLGSGGNGPAVAAGVAAAALVAVAVAAATTLSGGDSPRSGPAAADAPPGAAAAAGAGAGADAAARQRAAARARARARARDAAKARAAARARTAANAEARRVAAERRAEAAATPAPPAAPTTEPRSEPPSEPTAEPAPATTAEPVPESPAEPAPGPTAEPVSEPTPAEPAPAAPDPEPAPTPEPAADPTAAAPQPPITDAGVEFELR